MNNFYIDIHIIQTVPPSCINRDDTGSPKTAVYGGKTRARVSSQAWKHAVRLMFRDIFDQELLGDRTKRVTEMVVKHIKAVDSAIDDAKAEKLALDACKAAGISMDKKKEQQSDVLMFISNAQAREIARLAVEKNNGADVSGNDFKAALRERPSVDMALFGRMVASDPSLNYDASAQVAHSISTHTVHNEYDYFTAVDDLSPEDNAGAGHLGTVEYNSATLYRYATVNVNELCKDLGNDIAVKTVKGFVGSLVRSMPTGKQNTFANRTYPDYVYVTVRNDQPANLSGAFEKPVTAKDEGYVKGSIEALSKYSGEVYKNYASAPAVSWDVGASSIGAADEHVTFKELLDKLETYMTQRLSETEVM